MRQSEHSKMHALHMRSDASLTAIQSSLRHLRARQIAMIFPLGQSTALSDPRTLRQLALDCQRMGKAISIIGGDETLRALAVAAGFVVATALEDDEQPASQRNVPRHIREDWEDAYVEFATRRSTHYSRPLAADDEPLRDDPPEYVRRLMEDSPALLANFDDNAAGVQRARRTTRKLPDLADAEFVRETYESDEENLTETIRATGTTASAPHLSVAPRFYVIKPSSDPS